MMFYLSFLPFFPFSHERQNFTESEVNNNNNKKKNQFGWMFVHREPRTGAEIPVVSICDLHLHASHCIGRLGR
jgi:hypothetical protein